MPAVMRAGAGGHAVPGAHRAGAFRLGLVPQDADEVPEAPVPDALVVPAARLEAHYAAGVADC
jgi:hypothetical protein